MNKILIVGLGNPEGKYFQTYHNLGFLAADALAKRLDLKFKKSGNQSILIIPPSIKGVDAAGGRGFSGFVLKPLTYMNLSGQAVVAVSRKRKITPENIIVFVDDLYIDKGKIRISRGGSSAGHNGIASITELLGTNQYVKIRIGIKPDKPLPSGTANFVLSKIKDDEKPVFDIAIQDAVDAALSLAKGEPLASIQNRFNATNEGSR